MINSNIFDNDNKKDILINENDSKKLLINLVNDIITGTFMSADNLKQPYSLIHTNYFNFKQIFTYYQNMNSLCGFHSLFNIYYFLQYLKAKENDKNKNKNNYLFYLKNAWSFWSFYKESLNFLLSNLPLGIKARDYLIKGGSLERYQFVYLLKEFPKIKTLFNEMNDNYIISFTKFLYGFGIFNGTIDEAIDFQEKMNNFMENKNKTKEKILIILLGIVNHWNILILHKNTENHLEIYFLDSRNTPEIFESFELFDEKEKKEEIKLKIKSIKDIYIQKEIEKKNKKVSNWYITCLKEWYDSMNESMIIIFKILKKEWNLLNYVVENKIAFLINSFTEKTNIDLTNLEKEIKFINYRNGIWSWIKEDYHPAYFKDNILYDLNKTKIQIKEKGLINWMKLMTIFLNNEKENNEIEEEKKDLINRYLKEISELKAYVNLSKI